MAGHQLGEVFRVSRKLEAYPIAAIAAATATNNHAEGYFPTPAGDPTTKGPITVPVRLLESIKPDARAGNLGIVPIGFESDEPKRIWVPSSAAGLAMERLWRITSKGRIILPRVSTTQL